MQYFASEPRDFIDLLSYCKTNSISGERMEDSVSRLLNDNRGQLTVEKLRAILGNNHHAPKPIKDDSICLMSKRQLTTVSELMY